MLPSNLVTKFRAIYEQTPYCDKCFTQNPDCLLPNIQADTTAKKKVTRPYRKTETGLAGEYKRIRSKNNFDVQKITTLRNLPIHRPLHIHIPRKEISLPELNVQDRHQEHWRVKQSAFVSQKEDEERRRPLPLKKTDMEEAIFKIMFDSSSKAKYPHVSPEMIEQEKAADNIDISQLLFVPNLTPTTRAQHPPIDNKVNNKRSGLTKEAVVERFIEFINQLDTSTRNVNRNLTHESHGIHTPYSVAKQMNNERSEKLSKQAVLERIMEFINEMETGTQNVNRNLTYSFLQSDTATTPTPYRKDTTAPFIKVEQTVRPRDEYQGGSVGKFENMYLNNLYFRNYPNYLDLVGSALPEIEDSRASFADDNSSQTRNYEAKQTKKNNVPTTGSSTRYWYTEPRKLIRTISGAASTQQVTTQSFQQKMLRVEKQTKPAMINRNDPTILNWMQSYLANVVSNKTLAPTAAVSSLPDFTPHRSEIDPKFDYLQRVFINSLYSEPPYPLSSTSSREDQSKQYEELFPATPRELSIPENLHRIIENLMRKTNKMIEAKYEQSISLPTKRETTNNFLAWFDDRDVVSRPFLYTDGVKNAVATSVAGKNTVGSTYRRHETIVSQSVEPSPPSMPCTALYLHKVNPGSPMPGRHYNFENPLRKYVLGPTRSPATQDVLYFIAQSPRAEPTRPSIPVDTRQEFEGFRTVKPVHYLPLVVVPPSGQELRSWYDKLKKITVYRTPPPVTQAKTIHAKTSQLSYIYLPKLVTREYITLK